MIARGRFLLSAAIVAAAFLNLWQVTQTLRWVKPREADDVVVLEDRLRFVRDALDEGRILAWRCRLCARPASPG